MSSVPDLNAKIRVTEDVLRRYHEVASAIHEVASGMHPSPIQKFSESPRLQYTYAGHDVIVDETAKSVAFDVGVLPHTREAFLALIAPTGVNCE